MVYQRLADLVVLIHLLFVLLVLVGGLAVLRWPRLAWVQLPAALWGVAIELGGWVCPLTPVENALRRQGGGSPYSLTFVEHYLVPLLYPLGLTRQSQWVFGLTALGLNLAIYLWLWRRHLRGKGH